MKEDKLIPKRRFKEFENDEAWEQRKLGEVLKTESFRPYLKEPEADGKYKIIQQGDNPLVGYANGEPYRDYKKIVLFGDHTLSLYKPKSPFFISTDGVKLLYGTNNLYGNFLLYLLENYKPKTEGYKRYYSILKDQYGYLPSNINEQQKIGVFFMKLDNLITLHQRKLKKLKDLKLSYLSEIFPKEGEKYPKLRFKGFTGAWEQRKLGEIAIDIVAGGDINKGKIKDSGKYPVIANALTNDGIVGYYEEDFRIKAPAVTVTGRGDVGHAKARNLNFTPVVRLLSITSNHDINFLENAINNINVVVESTGVPQLTIPQLEKYKINIPNNPDEEKAIGTFFTELDNLITLHQRKLEKLENIKKAYLNEMFV